MADRPILAKTVAFALMAYGIAGIFARGAQLGSYPEGVIAAAVDPGFTVVSIVALPLAAYPIIWKFPGQSFRETLVSRPVRFLLLALLCFGTVTVLVSRDAWGAIYERTSTPEMFADSALRNCLRILRQKQMGPVSHPPRPTASCPDPVPSTDSALRLAYKARIDTAFAASARASIDSMPFGYQQFVAMITRYHDDASPYAFYGAFGSLLAIWWVALLILLPLLIVIGFAPPNGFWEKQYLTAVVLLVIWLGLVPLSQLQINFGQLDTNYTIYDFGIGAAIAVLIGWFTLVKDRKKVSAIIGALLTAASGAFAILGRVNQPMLRAFHDVLFRQGVSWAFGWYTILLIVMLFVAGPGIRAAPVKPAAFRIGEGGLKVDQLNDVAGHE